MENKNYKSVNITIVKWVHKSYPYCNAATRQWI